MYPTHIFACITRCHVLGPDSRRIDEDPAIVANIAVSDRSIVDVKDLLLGGTCLRARRFFETTTTK